MLTLITPEQFAGLSRHDQWVRSRCADLSRRAWRKSAHFRDTQKRMYESDAPCALCATTSASAWSIDHIWPLVLGGTHEDSNLQLTCLSCNSRKGARV